MLPGKGSKLGLRCAGFSAGGDKIGHRFPSPTPAQSCDYFYKLNHNDEYICTNDIYMILLFI